eukprot:TRINITY_DN2571_c0_g1_i1.p1 TRINITY_DN2571_c0_g1~~TRINITY_DN2571_c0_g1_i1.p1  ORF type:complete len:243 (+),score=67.34 TRINITY_DN2571_c0_g1_i1:513-1241(+)
MDFRGHGSTMTVDESDFSASRLVEDAYAVILETIPQDMPFVVVGHSMGGGIAVHLCASKELPSLLGLIVVDVVEGTALPALHFMRDVVSRRPKSFPSVSRAIEWSVLRGLSRNRASASVSVPPQLKKVTNGPIVHYEWRTDLLATEAFWKGWFEGMSVRFLSIPVPKMLLAAGMDRLDRNLTIAHMQGKFQLQIIRSVGHAIHEDAPQETANVIQSFILRYLKRTLSVIHSRRGESADGAFM